MIDCIKSGIRSIFRKKIRSFLTIIGVAIGVLSVMIISTIGNIGRETINSELNSVGLGGLAVYSNREMSNVRISDDELNLIASQKEITHASPIMIEYGKSEFNSEEERSLIWGVDKNINEVVKLSVLNGRMFNRSDIVSSANVCVVDESFALATYKRTNIVGKTIYILINGTYEEFKVVGVVASGGNILQNLIGNYIPNFVYVPFTTLQRLSFRSDFDQIIVNIEKSSNPDVVSNNLKSLLEDNNGVKGSIETQNLVKQKQQLDNILGIVTLILSSIACISLIVSGLSIMTVMLFSVRERTREIGIKKSIGANKLIILFEFMVEAFMISLIGSISGIIPALIVSYIGCSIFSIPFSVDFSIIFFCIGFSVTLGIIFGAYPALKAAKLNPVDALRFE